MNDMRFLERIKPTAEDRRQLVARLSQPAQDTIAAAREDMEQKRLIHSWVNAAVFSRRGNQPHVAKEVLDEFFAGLDAAEKDYLNNLPPDRKRQQLQWLYMRMRRPGEARPAFAPKNRRRGGLD